MTTNFDELSLTDLRRLRADYVLSLETVDAEIAKRSPVESVVDEVSGGITVWPLEDAGRWRGVYTCGEQHPPMNNVLLFTCPTHRTHVLVGAVDLGRSDCNCPTHGMSERALPLGEDRKLDVTRAVCWQCLIRAAAIGATQ